MSITITDVEKQLELQIEETSVFFHEIITDFEDQFALGRITEKTYIDTLLKVKLLTETYFSINQLLCSHLLDYYKSSRNDSDQMIEIALSAVNSSRDDLFQQLRVLPIVAKQMDAEEGADTQNNKSKTGNDIKDQS